MRNSALLVKSATTSHLAEIESMRAKWQPKVTRMVARRLASVRSVHPAAMSGAMQGERNDWIATFTDAYDTVGAAFATHSLEVVAARAGMPDFDASTSAVYKGAYNGFMRTYLGNHVPAYVDQVQSSIAAHLAVLGSEEAKALVRPRTPPRPVDDQGNADENVAATPDFAEQDPSYGELVDALFDSVALTVGTMSTLTASSLGPLAGANAFSEASDMELTKVWNSVEDKHTRPDHAEANGQEQALNDPFTVGDSQLMFPTDESLGASMGQIMFCRCVELFDVSSAKRHALRLDWPDRLIGIVAANLGREEE